MQYEEFVFIFEDSSDETEPHTKALSENLEQAEEIADDVTIDFLKELEAHLVQASDKFLKSFLERLRDASKKNGGFPDSTSMNNELLD